jgi:hypothetical protein
LLSAGGSAPKYVADSLDANLMPPHFNAIRMKFVPASPLAPVTHMRLLYLAVTRGQARSVHVLTLYGCECPQ